MRTFHSVSVLVLLVVLAACSPSRDKGIGPFEALESPAGDGATGPRFSQLEDGSLVLAWMEKGETGGTLRAATFENQAFAQTIDIVTDDRMLVNWADMPSVTHVSDNVDRLNECLVLEGRRPERATRLAFLHPGQYKRAVFQPRKSRSCGAVTGG